MVLFRNNLIWRLYVLICMVTECLSLELYGVILCIILVLFFEDFL